MLNEQEASRIVGACIRAVSHVSTVKLTGTLKDSKISTDGRVIDMVSLIFHDEEIGVRSLNHQIRDDNAFRSVGPSTPVFDVIDIVRTKATRIQAAKAAAATKTESKKSVKAAGEKSKKAGKSSKKSNQ
jgi:hypothetical protein